MYSFISLLIISIHIFFLTNVSKANELNNCYKIATKVEKEFKIPNKLLSSISITETGITKNGIYQPWPWSLNVRGESKFFDSRKEMTVFLEQVISKKQSNVDIGCMQLNYKYHRKMFKNLKNMVNPEENIYYAGKFLKELFHKHKSWKKAIARYHSSDPLRMKVYLEKVLRHWENNREGLYNYPPTKKENFVKINKKVTYRKTNELKIIYFRRILTEERIKRM